MNVSLTPELERFIAAKVESGRYASTSEVIRDGLRLLVDKESDREEQLAAFNKELGRRIASADRGEFITAEEFETRLQRKMDAFREANKV